MTEGIIWKAFEPEINYYVILYGKDCSDVCELKKIRDRLIAEIKKRIWAIRCSF